MSFRVVGIGELLWDMLPSGLKLGGAPANFAYHASALGADARVISRVGHDPGGLDALAELRRLGVPTDCIETDDNLPTGSVTVELTGAGQPRYTIHENVAWDALGGEDPGRAAVAAAAAVCFGTLAQRAEVSRKTIRALLRETPSSALRIFDINLRPPYFSKALIEESLVFANVLKLNESELPYLTEMFGLAGDVRSQIRELSARFDLRCIAFTRGSEGSVLFAGNEWSELPAVKTTVIDTVGAGDAFTAAVALGLLFRWPLDTVNRCASEVAAFVCSQAGATPSIRESIRAQFRQ